MPNIGTAAGRLAIAIDCAATIETRKRPPVPVRPVALPNDEALIGLNEAQERGERLGASDAKLLQRFFSWRLAVLKQESRCCGNLVALFYMARLLIEAKRPDDAERITAFLHMEYGVPEIPANAGDDRAVAERYARRREVLPLWLITMKRSDLQRGSK